MTTLCSHCKREVSKTEIGLTKKLLGKNTTNFLCLKCLSSYFNVDENLLKEKVEQFKKSGCSLFK